MPDSPAAYPHVSHPASICVRACVPAQRALQRREQTISEKSKDVSIVVGYCGTATKYLYTPEGATYRKSEALGGAFGADPREAEAAARYQAAAPRREAAARRASGAAQAIGMPSHRFRLPPGSKPLVAPSAELLDVGGSGGVQARAHWGRGLRRGGSDGGGTQQHALGRLSNGGFMPPRQLTQEERARQRFNTGKIGLR